MIDIVLLRMIKYRKDWSMLKDVIPKANLADETKALVDDFGKYFVAYPSHDTIDLMTFLPKFRTWHAGMSDDQFASYTSILRNIAPDPDEDQRRNILQDYADIELWTKLANMADEFNEGELDEDSYTAVTQIMDGYRKRRGLKAMTFIQDPIEDLLQDEFDDAGIKWRLACLNNSMRPLRGGDFGIIAGRPDQGKTTFMTSEVTFMAPQLPADRNIVWLNNEGPGKRIKPRLYQSALGLTMSELKIACASGNLPKVYAQKVGGLDRIRIFDIHGMSNGMVANILEENNPGIAIFDMIDNINGFGDAARTDLMLEKMYQWARELMVKLDCIGLAGSQISQDGDNMRFPTMPMLKDSKTGKQGACDFQLMIGSIDDPSFQYSRFIGLPKNKLQRPDGKKDPKAEVQFLATKARYEDIKEIGSE